MDNVTRRARRLSFACAIAAATSLLAAAAGCSRAPVVPSMQVLASHYDPGTDTFRAVVEGLHPGVPPRVSWDPQDSVDAADYLMVVHLDSPPETAGRVQVFGPIYAGPKKRNLPGTAARRFGMFYGGNAPLTAVATPDASFGPDGALSCAFPGEDGEPGPTYRLLLDPTGPRWVTASDGQAAAAAATAGPSTDPARLIPSLSGGASGVASGGPGQPAVVFRHPQSATAGQAGAPGDRLRNVFTIDGRLYGLYDETTRLRLIPLEIDGAARTGTPADGEAPEFQTPAEVTGGWDGNGHEPVDRIGDDWLVVRRDDMFDPPNKEMEGVTTCHVTAWNFRDGTVRQYAVRLAEAFDRRPTAFRPKHAVPVPPPAVARKL